MHTKMSKQEIINELVAYIKRTSPAAANAASIPLDGTIFENGLLDSFAVVELVAFVENTWSIKISDSEMTSDVLGGLDKIAQLVVAKQ